MMESFMIVLFHELFAIFIFLCLFCWIFSIYNAVKQVLRNRRKRFSSGERPLSCKEARDCGNCEHLVCYLSEKNSDRRYTCKAHICPAYYKI